LRALRRRGVPALLVSGRVSPRSFRRYLWVRGFLRRVLDAITFFGMQSEADAERIRALGAPAERVRVTGSLKLEGAPAAPAIAIAGRGPLWIAASTHDGEEEACARAFLALRARHADLRWLLAPRHLDRLPAVEATLRGLGVEYVRRTALATSSWTGAPRVLLLDTLGELGGLYGGAAVAFVGGTLAPIGGHNLLEPARASVPVLYGPHVDKVAAVAEALEAAGGGARVAGEADLVARIDALLANPESRRRMGAAARSVVLSTGSVEASCRAVLACVR
jgi:3-deoxy-D-manno-octulosonic-acid transferase